MNKVGIKSDKWEITQEELKEKIMKYARDPSRDT